MAGHADVKTVISGMVHLVRVLEKRGQLSLTELAEILGTSEREVAEDVQLLSTCGIPPYSPADPPWHWNP